MLTYQSVIESCDKRIALIQVRLDKWERFNNALSFVQQTLDLNNEDKQIFDIKPREKVRQDNDKNSIALIKVERLIYTSLKNKADKSLFPRLLAKYDELMGVSYDMSGNMVLLNECEEGKYLDYCRESLKQREYIKVLCDTGVKGVKLFK